MVQDICKVANLLHPHLLNPVGVAIEVEKPLYIVYPFMENRDIKTYLRKLEGNTGSKVSVSSYQASVHTVSMYSQL